MKESTREALVESYLKLGLAEGVESVTLQKLSAESGFSFGTVQAYYDGSRERIQREATEFVMRHSKEFIDEWMSTSQKGSPLRLYAEALFHWAVKYRSFASFWVYIFYLGGVENKFRKELKSSRMRAYNRVEALILQEASFRAVKAFSPVKRKEVVEFLYSFVLGSGIMIISSKDSAKEIQSRLKSFEGMLKLIFKKAEV